MGKKKPTQPKPGEWRWATFEGINGNERGVAHLLPPCATFAYFSGPHTGGTVLVSMLTDISEPIVDPLKPARKRRGKK